MICGAGTITVAQYEGGLGTPKWNTIRSDIRGENTIMSMYTKDLINIHNMVGTQVVNVARVQ